MKKFISFGITIIFAIVLLLSNQKEGYKVIRVVDGDTIIVEFGDVEERVRLIGIDTPESVHADEAKNTIEGKIASDFTKSKLEGKNVNLEFDIEERDQYGRLLAYVWLDGKMFNRVLLEEGYAQIATFPPNVKYVYDFKLLERKAKENQRGFWSGQGENKETLEEKVSGNFKGSKNGDKYHLKDYTHDGQISPKNIIWFDTIEEAEEKGYKPCGICFN